MAVSINVKDLFDDVDIEVSCNDCNHAVEAEWYQGQIYVTPCPTCMEKESSEAYEDGLRDG